MNNKKTENYSCCIYYDSKYEIWKADLYYRINGKKIRKTFSDKPEGNVNISCVSFGYKHGIPRDCDIMFDVRCFLNPFYVKGLREKTGNDEEIVDFVFSQPEAKVLLEKYIDVIDYSLPLYIKEGKSHLTIGFGCTGGKHRSVTLANALFHALGQEKHTLLLQHHDIEKDARHKK